MHKFAFFVKLMLDFEKFFLKFSLVFLRLTDIMKHDDKTDDVKFLFVDAGIIEKSFLVEFKELLFKFSLHLKNISLNSLEVDLPLLALLFNQVLLFLNLLCKTLLLVLSHIFFFLCIHPIFSD